MKTLGQSEGKPGCVMVSPREVPESSLLYFTLLFIITYVLDQFGCTGHAPALVPVRGMAEQSTERGNCASDNGGP